MSLFGDMVRRLEQSPPMVKNIFALMTGTAIAQAIPIIVSPILLRIYTPEDFGVLAVFMAITSILGIFATGRYDVAIMLPAKEKDSASLLILSCSIAFVLSFLTLFLILLFHDQLVAWIENDLIADWLYLVPLSMFLVGILQSLTYWNNRQSKFAYVARAQVGQGTTTAGSQIGLGCSPIGSGGLIIGTLIGQVVCIVMLSHRNFSRLLRQTRQVSRLRVLKNVVKYKNFPLYSSWGSVFNAAASQMPVFILAASFGLATSGLFALTTRVLAMPLTLISSAVYNVMLQRVTEVYNSEPEKLTSLVLRSAGYLAILSLPIIISMNLFGEFLFIFVFGDEWAKSGEMAAVLSFAIAVRFAVSPLSTVLALNHNIKKGVAWQTTYFLTLSITLFLAREQDLETFLLIYVVHEILLYLAFFVLILIGTRPPKASADRLS